MSEHRAIAPTFDRRSLLRGAAALGLAEVLPAKGFAAASFKGASQIQAMIAERIAARQLPGAIVSLSTGSPRPEYVYGGTLDFESETKVDENTLFRLASMTKPIVGMAIMLLISERQLKLDQPVADFIPGFVNMRVIPDPGTGETRSAARLITVRHLLTHTSGILNDPTGTIAEAYRHLGVSSGQPGTSAPADALPPPKSLEEWTNRISQVPLTSDPGTKWQYSPNPDILGRVIEVISGMPFDIFLARRMFLPIDMRSTYFWVPARDKGRLITMYARRDGQLVAADRSADSRLLTKPAIPRGSGGLISTARDYDRFLAMIVNQGILDGRRVFPADAVRLGTSNLLPEGTNMTQYTSRTGFDGFGALGLVTTGGPRPGTYGWGGSSGTTGFCNPQLKSRWISFTNIGASDFGRRAMAAADMTFSQAVMPGGAERIR